MNSLRIEQLSAASQPSMRSSILGYIQNVVFFLLSLFICFSFPYGRRKPSETPVIKPFFVRLACADF